MKQKKEIETNYYEKRDGELKLIMFAYLNQLFSIISQYTSLIDEINNSHQNLLPSQQLFKESFNELLVLKYTLFPHKQNKENHSNEKSISLQNMPNLSRKKLLHYIFEIPRVIQSVNNAKYQMDENNYFPSFKCLIRDAQWNDKGKGFLSLFTKVPKHIALMRDADNFTTIRSYATQALQTQPLCRHADVTRLYRAISLASSSFEAYQNYTGLAPKNCSDLMSDLGFHSPITRG